VPHYHLADCSCPVHPWIALHRELDPVAEGSAWVVRPLRIYLHPGWVMKCQVLTCREPVDGWFLAPPESSHNNPWPMYDTAAMTTMPLCSWHALVFAEERVPSPQPDERRA
jgi:hypothetical protein